MKALIALQFWEGDRVAAIRLGKFLAALEPKHSELADILLVNRFDCRPADALVDCLSRKFNLYTYRTRSRMTGWPAGCNGMWISTMEWVHSMVDAKKVPNYKFVFTCEADGTPLRRDWISRLHKAWDRENAVVHCYVAGPLVGADNTIGVPEPHINGNAMFSCDPKFLRWVLKIVPTCGVQVGWDYAMRKEFLKWNQQDVPEIRSLYNTPFFSRSAYEDMWARDWVWIHGDKSGCLCDYGKERFQL